MNEQDNRTLTEKVLTMTNDELLSRLVNSWHFIEEMRRRAEYHRADGVLQEEYSVYRREAERRMS